MFLDVVREITDFLNDPSQGVNAQLTSMSLQTLYDGSDTQPADIETIVDETRNIQVARREIPEEAAGVDKPSISIFIFDAVVFGAPGVHNAAPEVAQSQRDATIQLVIRYHIKEIESEEALRDAHYYARATGKCLKAFSANSTARTRNQVQFRNLLEMEYEPLFREENDTAVQWYYRLTYHIRDLRP